jgi:hypothetical protein
MITNDKECTINLLDRKTAWTDASGALDIQINKKSDRSSCADIFSNRSLGYGTYSVIARDTSRLEPTAAFSMFTFDEQASEQHYRAMDVEVGRKGEAANTNNAQCVIQPFRNKSEVIKRGRARRVLVLGSLLLVAQFTSDRDGDR